MFQKKIFIKQKFSPTFSQNTLKRITPKFKGYWIFLEFLFKFLPSRLKILLIFPNKKLEIPIDLKDPYQIDIFFKDKYELMEPYIISRLLPDQGIFYDVGANCGWYTRIISKLKKKSIIYAFEPNNKSFNFLKEFCSNNVLTLPIAVGKDSFNKVVPINPFYRQPSGTYFKKAANGINLISLDTFSSKHNIFPNFIKIDVEGFELEVLQGSYETLNFSKFLLIEVNNSKSVKGCDYDPNLIFDILKNKGFIFKYLISNKENSITKIEHLEIGSILFSKENIEELL